MEGKYNLEKILEAASHFANREGAQEQLTSDLKNIQSKKDGCKPEEVKEIDPSSLHQALSKETAPSCLGKVIFVIVEKYEELVAT